MTCSTDDDIKREGKANKRAQFQLCPYAPFDFRPAAAHLRDRLVGGGEFTAFMSFAQFD